MWNQKYGCKNICTTMSFLFSQSIVPDGGCSCVHLSLFSVTALTMFRETSLQKLNKVL